MVVDRDEEEKGAHVYPITCAKLLSGEIFNFLKGRQNWDTLDTQSPIKESRNKASKWLYIWKGSTMDRYGLRSSG